jgi:hypothetical protein
MINTSNTECTTNYLIKQSTDDNWNQHVKVDSSSVMNLTSQKAKNGDWEKL